MLFARPIVSHRFCKFGMRGDAKRETSNGLAIGIYMKYEVLCVLHPRHSTYFLWLPQGKPQIHWETSSGFAIGMYKKTLKSSHPQDAETQIYRETPSGSALRNPMGAKMETEKTKGSIRTAVVYVFGPSDFSGLIVNKYLFFLF